MDDTTDRLQDHPLDESTGVNPQHFDADGYVVGQPHHDTVANEDLTAEGRLVSEVPGTGAPGAATAAFGTTASAAPASADGQFDDQRMPTTDGELSDADAMPRAEASIAPPPGGPADPDAPVPGPEGVPPGPDVTPPEPNPLAPDEPTPFDPEEPDQLGGPSRTVGGEAF